VARLKLAEEYTDRVKTDMVVVLLIFDRQIAEFQGKKVVAPPPTTTETDLAGTIEPLANGTIVLNSHKTKSKIRIISRKAMITFIKKKKMK
jgi:hypothetical protein